MKSITRLGKFSTEFGDPYKVSMIYLKQVHEWQAIKPNDAQGLKKLSLFLLKCANVVECLSYLSMLDHPPSQIC